MFTIDDQVASAERVIDAKWRRMAVPRGHFSAAAWVLLSVCEDLMRFPLTAEQLMEVFSDDNRYVRWIDDLKYALKYALAKLSNECPSGSLHRAPRKMIGSDYSAASDLLRTGMRFRAAMIAFSAYRDGSDQCELRNDVLAFIPSGDFDLRYRAREYMEGTIAPKQPRAGSPIFRIRDWLAEPPLPVQTAIEMITVEGQRVRSPGDKIALTTIFDQLPDASYILPPQWRSPFGAAAVVARILHALRSHCAWSFLRVTMGKVFHGENGHGLEWLAPVASRNGLAETLAEVAGAPLLETRRVLELLTYGTGVQSPDPALQPFVAVGPDMVCYAPLFICGSGLERNFLSLLARADRRAFDAASDAFEVHMTGQLRVVLDRRPWLASFNTHIPGGQAAGEVDVIVVDAPSRQVLVLELWWMIPPGETREVLQREANARTKGAQVARKRDAARANLARLLAKSGHGSSVDGWNVACALVSESFLPISPLGDVPVLTRRTLQFALKQNDRLSDVVAWITSEVWLPKEGEHFTREYDESSVDDIRFTNLGVGVLEAGFLHARETIDRDA